MIERRTQGPVVTVLSNFLLFARSPAHFEEAKMRRDESRAVEHFRANTQELYRLTEDFVNGERLDVNQIDDLRFLLSTKFRSTLDLCFRDSFREKQMEAREKILDYYDVLVALPDLETTPAKRDGMLQYTVSLLSGSLRNRFIMDRLLTGAKHPLAPVWLIPRLKELESRYYP